MIDYAKEQATWSRLTPKAKRGVLAMKENAQVVDGRIYDQNGDDKSHLVELVVKTTEAQREALKAVDELSAHEVENGHFVFAMFQNRTTAEETFPSLSQADLARVMFLGTYTGYRTGRLQHDNGRVINRKGLEELVGISRARFSEFYGKVLDEEILREEDGELFVNPSVFYRGPLSESEYNIDEYRHTRLFRKTVRELYAQYKGRKAAQLAIIYSLLPFLNFNTNVVCYNPQEADEDLLRPMSLDNLAALLGYKDTDKLRRALDGMKLDGKPVFWLPYDVNDKRKKKVVINPRVVFAGKAESLKAVKVLFA